MLKYILVLLLWRFQNGRASEKLLHKIITSNEGTKNPFEDKSLIECVVDLTQIALSFTPTILVLENELDDNDDKFYNEMIETFAERDIPIAIQDRTKHKVDQSLDVYDGNVIVIVQLENIAALLNFNTGAVDKRVKHLVIISEVTKDALIALETTDRRFIDRDFTLIIQNPVAERHSIITFQPSFDGTTCSSMTYIQPTEINVCINGHLETDLVFPQGIKFDFKNCSRNIGMASMFPFSKIPYKDELDNYDLIDEIEGSDVEIIKIIMHHFNASPVLRYIRRDEQNPFVNTEYVNFMVNGSYEVCAGGLYRIYEDAVSYSGVYTRQAVIWIYKTHRPSRSWDTLVPKLKGMYLFYLFYICYSILSYFFRKYDSERSSIKDILLFSWGTLIGGGSLLEPKTQKQRILDIFYLILSIYLAAYMNIQLFSFLTIEGSSIYFKTNEDVIESGRTPYLNYKNKDFVQDKKYLTFSNTSSPCGSFFDCSNAVLVNDGLTIILDEYFYPLQAKTAVKDEAQILRTADNLITIYQEMIIPKDSPLVVGIQNVLKRLFEAGICQKLFEEAIGISVVAKAKSANKNAVNNSHSCEAGCAITLTQIAGIFYVWGIGCVLSVCVFLMESLWRKRRSI